jgi:hypothetical protein
MRLPRVWLGVSAVIALSTAPAPADVFHFSTGTVLNNMAVDTRPGVPGKFEIEAGDDFVLTAPTAVTHATFTGLLTNPQFNGGIPPSSVNSVTVEIYRVFPNLSNVGRTSGPPTFSTFQVPTRVNSPSDVELDDRNSPGGTLSFSVKALSTFTGAMNSIQPGGIHPLPGISTGGNGAITGTEVAFDVTFTTPFLLPPDHYFFVPQVDVSNGEFFWLNASRPIDATGTPFAPDLQSWTRDQFLDPDWLRVGTDIVGGTPAPTFNQAFSLDGTIIPEPAALALLGAGLACLAAARDLRRRVGAAGPAR